MSNAYTFKVDLTIQVIADNEEEAQNNLDRNGGFITERSVEIIATTPLPPIKEDDGDKKDS